MEFIPTGAEGLRAGQTEHEKLPSTALRASRAVAAGGRVHVAKQEQ